MNRQNTKKKTEGRTRTPNSDGLTQLHSAANLGGQTPLHIATKIKSTMLDKLHFTLHLKLQAPRWTDSTPYCSQKWHPNSIISIYYLFNTLSFYSIKNLNNKTCNISTIIIKSGSQYLNELISGNVLDKSNICF